MSDNDVRALADAAGVSPTWRDVRGHDNQVSLDVLKHILDALDLPNGSSEQIEESHMRLSSHPSQSAVLPALITSDAGMPVRISSSDTNLAYQLVLETGETVDGIAHTDSGSLIIPAITTPGYHTLSVNDATTTLAIAPPRCFSLNDAGCHRTWGLTAQIYGLRRTGDEGAGDFTALAQFCASAAGYGADAVAISPVHALFAADPYRFGPYAPSSRLFLNPLYADASFLGQGAFLDTDVIGDAKRSGLDLVDWVDVARDKMAGFRTVHAAFAQRPEADPLTVEFAAFRRQGGQALEDHARFEALHSHVFGQDQACWHWRTWPQGFQNPKDPAVHAFAQERAQEVEFYAFLQWITARGLANAQQSARDAGMGIGLIADLAVGTDSGGSHAWSHRNDMLRGLSVGAPPDFINAVGQNWGLTTFSPHALQERGYRAFIELLRASLRYAGGMRIDHVMGLSRLWVVPEGGIATQGAYLRYPLDILLRLVRLESHRHRAIIIGEDLGTVPDGFRETLEAAAVLGMRVLPFERQGSRFTPPHEWSSDAVAMTTTHDIPPLAGWWRGHDIDWRARLDLLGDGNTESAEQSARAQDRKDLWNALAQANVCEGKQAPASDQPEPFVDAALAYTAKARSGLALFPAEDILGLHEQPNIPGTVDEHPNWRRRLPGLADQVLDTRDASNRLKRIAQTRDSTS